MMRTKFGATDGILVETDFKTPFKINHGEEITAPYTLMTYQQQGYVAVYKVTKNGFIWFSCGQRTHFIGNIKHGAAFLKSDPEFYECLLVGTYGLHFASIKKSKVHSRHTSEPLLQEIEIKRLWKNDQTMVFVHPFVLEPDGS
jgi:hypothetical protein